MSQFVLTASMGIAMLLLKLLDVSAAHKVEKLQPTPNYYVRERLCRVEGCIQV